MFVATTPVVTTLPSQLNVHTRATFVRATVKTTALTERIITAALPYFPKQCVCIAGYLDNSDQFWKVNYHWDLLNYKLGQFIANKAVSAHLRQCATAIKNVLVANPPDPRSGYRNDKSVNATKDRSKPEQIVARHKALVQSKKDFQAVLLKAGTVKAATRSNPSAVEKAWWLAVAPVAAPGDSKHGSGYALDIAGNNAEASRISRVLGATLVFNESSHVHVEWANGVRVGGHAAGT